MIKYSMSVARLLAIITVITYSQLLCGCGGDSTSPSNEVMPKMGELSFQQQVKPIFSLYGCLSCHGGTAGLSVGTVSQLLLGGDHGPAIIPGNADTSLIIMKLSPAPPFGDRMPRGGPYLPDSAINIIKRWINEGAKNN